MLSDSPPERDLPWSEAGIEGCARFVQRLWRLFGQFDAAATGEDKALDRKRTRLSPAWPTDIEALSFNKAVARIYELTGAIEKAALPASRSAAIRALLLLVAPMMPHLAEEAWSGYGQRPVADAAWPEVDPALLVEDEVTIAVQVKGKLRDTVTVNAKGVARAIGTVTIDPIEGKAGWLVANALKDRIAPISGGDGPSYRLHVELDDQIAGFGVRQGDTVTRERRQLRARYQLFDAATGVLVMDMTAASDSSFDAPGSEFATIAAEDTALERLADTVADQIVTRMAQKLATDHAPGAKAAP
jgi:leucyl-tRNA synthetase